jgi:DnaK suppressor protein
MDESVIEDLRSRLEAEHAAIGRDADLGADDRAVVALDQQSIGRLSRMDAMQRQAMAAAQHRRTQARLGAIAAALARIAEAEYGYCLECGDEIAIRRLEIDPTLTTCVACARGDR